MTNFPSILRTWMRASVLLFGLASIGTEPIAARADGIDDFNSSWAGRALAAQRVLDLNTPLRDVGILGAHNSFNSSAYSYFDPNQIDSTFNQLRMGARAIEFDVHWTAKTEGVSFPDRLLLCHGTAAHIGCGLSDRYFAEGLDEIAAWLGTANSIDQVLILHIEDHMDGQHGEAFAQVNARFGHLIFPSGGCRDMPGDLTKATVLAAGKKVLLWSEGGCSADGNWNSIAFTGLGDLSRVWEDSTTLGGIGGSGSSIDANALAAYFAGGMNIVDLDQLHQNDPRLQAAIWSWDTNEPNNAGGNEDCAVQIANGRWNDADCAGQHAFACENMANGSWAISAISGSWGAGAFACDGLGSDYQFAVPTNSQDNQLLSAARAAAAQPAVWLNHDDRAVEGSWSVNSSNNVFYNAGAFSLHVGESASGPSRTLTMEADCSLVLYSTVDGVIGGDLWNSGTANAGSDCYVNFQSDGNLVLYTGGGQALWSSSTSGAELHIQADGNLVIYDGGGAALWQTHTNYPAAYDLAAGQFLLSAGQILHTQNRKLQMHEDCNLVLYSFENGHTGGPVWSSNTAGGGSGCYADFQADGNFVVYNAGDVAQWASGTSGTAGGRLVLQEDGNMVVYNGANEPLWTSQTGIAEEITVNAGQFLLNAGQFIQTRNRKLLMTADCELVVYSVVNAIPGGAIWQSGTFGAGSGCYADFQADGNFVIYDSGGNYHWDSGTSGTSGGQLRLQTDGNLVLYNGAGEPLWTANTNTPAEAMFDAATLLLSAGQFVQTQTRKLQMEPNCNLVLYAVANAIVGVPLWQSDTFGAGSDCYAEFQSDGNFVVYDGNSQPLWASGTSGTSGAQLWIQSDGNMVVYNGVGAPLWATFTNGNHSGVSVCGDTFCNGAEGCSTCPDDCGACPSVCGDFGCDEDESCSSCAADCGACPPVCGDDACEGDESCTTCAADCGACPPVCGDDACEGDESCTTCAADCGTCPPVCGDDACEGDESCTTCAADCGVCPFVPCPALLDSAPCVDAAKAKLQINESISGRESLKLKWKKFDAVTAQADFGNPVETTDAIHLCLYSDAGALVQQLDVDRGAQLCGGRDCWRAVGDKGYRYKDPLASADGVQKMSFLSGRLGSGKADVQAGNDASDGQVFLATGLATALASQTTPTVQMVSDLGFCLSATMTRVKRADGVRYDAFRK